MKGRPEVTFSKINDVYDQYSVESLSDWLSQAEADRVARIRCLDSRHRWLAGRWLAKQALTAVLGDPSIRRSSLHIESRDARGRGTVPRLFRDGRLTSIQLSISHAGRSIAVAVLDHWRARVGIDVIDCLAMTRETAQFWLCDRELDACDGNPYSCQIVWSLKEALYKAGVQGTRVAFSPRSIDTTEWISTSLLHELTTRVRSARPYSSAIKHGGELRVRRLDEEFLTLVTLRDPAEVSHTRTSQPYRFEKTKRMFDSDNSLPNAQGSEAVSR